MKFEEAGKNLEAEQPAVSRQKEPRYMKPVPDGWQEILSSGTGAECKFVHAAAESGQLYADYR